MLRATVVVAFVGAAGVWPASTSTAQETIGFNIGQPVTQAPGSVLRTIDDERLFRESQFGQRVTREINAASRELETENNRLLEELTAREAELTERRAEMTVEAFRAAANEFDDMAEDARRAQAEKRQRLSQFEEAERRRFFADIETVLQDVLEAEGGDILIDARAVIIARPALDMTDAAIVAMDAALGEGSPSPFPLSAP